MQKRDRIERMGFFRQVFFMVAVMLCFSQMIFSVPVFVTQPSISKTDSGVIINFSLSGYTDVTVEIEDNSNQTIRHLVSGILGHKAPPPLAPDTLVQSIFWDKKDDFGKLVSGPFTVNVLLGVQAKLDRFYGFDPNTNPTTYGANIYGIAIDSLGDVIKFTDETAHGFRCYQLISAFDRNGKYLRTLYPYPGYFSENKLKGFGRAALSDGRNVPRIYLGFTGNTWESFAGVVDNDMVVTPQGWLVFTTGNNAMYNSYATTGDKRLLITALDGSCPRDTMCGPIFPANMTIGTMPHLAVSPDGHWIYAAGIGNGTVYRSKLDTVAVMQSFISGLASPVGISTDGNGLVYVGENGPNTLKVFNSNGTILGQRSLPSQSALEHVKVSRKSGAIYILFRDNVPAKGGKCKIVKYGPFPGLDSLAEVTLNWNFGGSQANYPLIGIDDKNTPPIIWVSGLENYGMTDLVAVSDSSGTLTRTNRSQFKRTGSAWANGGVMPAPGYIAVSKDESVLLSISPNSGITKINLANNVKTHLNINSVELVFNWDNSFYSLFGDGVNSLPTWTRYDKEGTKINFPDKSPSKIGIDIQCRDGSGSRGIVSTRKGEIYVFHYNSYYKNGLVYKDSLGNVYNWRQKSSNNLRDTFNNTVSVYDSNLNLLRSKVVRAPSRAGGVGVDNNGNIFIAAGINPRGMTYPDIIKNNSFLPNPLTNDTAYRVPWAPYNYYLTFYGSVLKFPPTGGAIGKVPDSVNSVPFGDLSHDTVPTYQVSLYYKSAVKVQNPIWQYFGVFCNGTQDPAGGGDPGCSCFSPRFAVDDFGRVIVPDPYTFSVVLLDNNRNELIRFGDYGNIDQTGSSGALPSPEIPLGFAPYLTQVNRSIYISDLANQRVVKVKLTYSDSASFSTGTETRRSVPTGKPEMALQPNPFNPSVKIRLAGFSGMSPVTLAVYSANGRLVAKMVGSPGQSEFVWKGQDNLGRAVESGFYVFEAKSENRIVRSKAVLLK